MVVFSLHMNYIYHITKYWYKVNNSFSSQIMQSRVH